MSRFPAAKRRRLSPPGITAEAHSASISTSPPPPNGHPSAPVAPAAKWDVEQDYEQRPRKARKQREGTRLPVRTVEGWAEDKVAPASTEQESDLDSILSSSSRSAQEHGLDANEADEADTKPKLSSRQQIIQGKEELARIASLVNEDPEEHIGALRVLAQLAASENPTVKKLALATQATVFKDLIPGYRIRPLSDESMGDKVSKDVRKLRNFEQKLVSSYQTYVQDLAKLAKLSGSPSEVAAGTATVALSCACNLLAAVPHFNFRGDLLKIVVDKLSTRRVDKDFVKCRETLETLFANDEDGTPSLDAVTLLTKMMKSRNYNFDESVLNIFLHLRLLSEFGLKASYSSVDKAEDSQFQGKQMKPKREFRTKKQRKMLKERKVIEKEMKEADATVAHEERDRMQAETLKMVFVAYFRILKVRSPKLMGAVLEGLARYAHLINQDFFGDILEALRDIISTAEVPAAAVEASDEDEQEEGDESQRRNLTRESLLCVITAFALLQGQDAASAASGLKLDLNFFITHLYRILHPLSLNADIERSAKSLHLPDPHNPRAQTPNNNKINVQTTIVLLIRSLTSVLLPASALRAIPPIRIAAFCQQLMSISLQLPEKSCIAMLGLLTKITKIHGRKVSALWNTEERRGDGVFDALRPEIEGSNPFAGTIWEGEILRTHFCPMIREAIVGIEKNVQDAK